MSGAAGRKVHLIEILPLILAIGWGVATWQDIHAQVGALTGWTRLLLGWAMWILFGGGLVGAVRMRGSLGLRSVVPMALSAVALAMMPFVASTAAHHQEARFLADTTPYLELIEQVRSGAISPGAFPPESLPTALSGCCFHVELSRDSVSRMGGMFVTEMGFGPKFAGWLYSETPEAPVEVTYIGHRFEVRKVTAHWYRLTQ